MKYSEEITQRICDLIMEGNLTQKQICQLVGITPRTFQLWYRNNFAFQNAIKSSEKNRMDRLAAQARKSLHLLVDVYAYTENILETSSDGRQCIRVVRKVAMPNVNAIIYALNNSDPENFQRRKRGKIDITGTTGNLGELTLEQVRNELAMLGEI